jgi:hypothetical protein
MKGLGNGQTSRQGNGGVGWEADFETTELKGIDRFERMRPGTGFFKTTKDTKGTKGRYKIDKNQEHDYLGAKLDDFVVFCLGFLSRVDILPPDFPSLVSLVVKNPYSVRDSIGG